MKRFSQKPTDCVSTGRSSSRDQSVKPKISSFEKKEIATNRFSGMSKDLERVPPLHIPGYKSRG